MTYRGRDGRQYVVVSAGGHGAPIGPPLGDYVVAFALQKSDEGDSPAVAFESVSSDNLAARRA